MVDPLVKKLISQAKEPEETQSVMLQWTDLPDASLFENVLSKRERQLRMDGFYRALKESTFQRLRNEAQVEIRDMPASGSAILTAPASTLEKLVCDGGKLDREEKLQVLPNVMFDAI